MRYYSSIEADRLFSRLNTADPREVIDELSSLFGEREKQFPRTVFEYDTDHNHAWYLLGLSFENLRQPEKAADCFATAIELWPQDADSYVALSNVEPLSEKLPTLLERGVAETDDDRIRFNLANVYLELGQPQKALTHLKQISPSIDFYEDVKISLQRTMK